MPALPQYRSHKIVRAAAIAAIGPVEHDGVQLTLDVGGAPVAHRSPAQLVARGYPAEGDYLVIYEDGYESWSPKAAFESGYARHAPDGPQHVFAGEPDGRQSADRALATSRFRPRYRALGDDEKAAHDDLKAAFATVEAHIERLPPGRYRALALTALEESCMWAVKELTA